MNDSIPAVSPSSNIVPSSSLKKTNTSPSTIQIFGGNNFESSDIFYSDTKSKIIVNGKEIDPTDEKAIEEISQSLPENQKYPFITAVMESREKPQTKVSNAPPASKNIAVTDTPSVDWMKAFEPETTSVQKVVQPETTLVQPTNSFEQAILQPSTEQQISPQPAQQADEYLKESVIITIQPGQTLSKVVEKSYGIQGGGNCLEAANQLIFAEGNEKLAKNDTVTQNSSNSIRAGEKVVLPPTLSLGNSVYYLKNSPELEKAPRFIPPETTPTPELEAVPEPAPPTVSSTPAPLSEPAKKQETVSKSPPETKSKTKDDLPSKPKDMNEYFKAMLEEKRGELYKKISYELGITDTSKKSGDTSTAKTTTEGHKKTILKLWK